MTDAREALLLSALESMCDQYLGTDRGYEHAFMSAGEEACDVLCALFPDRYEITRWGMRRREDDE